MILYNMLFMMLVNAQKFYAGAQLVKEDFVGIHSLCSSQKQIKSLRCLVHSSCKNIDCI